MTQQEFIAAFTKPPEDWDHELIFCQARERLRRLKDEQQFHILFPIAVKAQDLRFPVCDSAILLRELSPDCPVSCEEAVRAMLPSWDISIEEVPFYLAARFGTDRVRRAVRAIESGTLSDVQKRMLDTVLYWLGKYDEAYGT
ncbi:MAG TPA: hypothetical protein VKV04_10495 [Verrucomicrobiae bacterium]|nr:hypothetical protein [Verrucomicrobiae bacterium]